MSGACWQRWHTWLVRSCGSSVRLAALNGCTCALSWLNWSCSSGKRWEKREKRTLGSIQVRFNEHGMSAITVSLGGSLVLEKGTRVDSSIPFHYDVIRCNRDLSLNGGRVGITCMRGDGWTTLSRDLKRSVMGYYPFFFFSSFLFRGQLWASQWWKLPKHVVQGQSRW